ncbi:MAG: relaxase domain-containing protein [Pirellulaceae bacterium]|nr:relaxase domain-containing protein [Pirellulaceae bacterium]
MLRIIQNSSAAGASSYYSTADYYTEGQELAGQWRGEGARLLGLSGEVGKAAWDALCDNRHPLTGQQLTPRQRDERRVGYDFNFHVPKSVSVMYSLTQDERILAAFRESVGDTMHDMEAEMQTRVRKSGKNEDRTTGNMVMGEFIHFTSRPVNGVPDPHLHAHCFVFNTTWDDKEAAWKAGQFRDLKRDAPYFQAVFHSRLADRLANLGYGIERNAKGWEIADLPNDVLDRYSRRTALIEQLAKEKGILDPAEKGELGAKTRERKAKNLTAGQLRDEWQSRMSADERASLADVQARAKPGERVRDDLAAENALQYAVGHCFERKSVVPERTLLAEALQHSVGQATVEEVQRQASASGIIIGTHKGRRMATTPTVLGEEQRIIRFAREGRGRCAALGDPSRPFKRDWLNESQRNAVRRVLGSRDRVMVIRGAAGVGKTSLMQEAVEAIQENGHEVFAFAPSADASRGVLRSEGFETADTVARLLKDEKLQRDVAGQVLWVDEAGLLGSKTTAELFDLADRLDCRVILQGDQSQHGSVERGGPLRLLEEEAGIVPAEVREIQRQKGQYMEAVKLLSMGHTEEGFNRLDDLGWIKEVPELERYRQLAADYVASVEAGKSALVVSPTHLEGERITDEIRATLKQHERLGRSECEFTVLESTKLTEAARGDRVNYQFGDVVQFQQNAKGFRRGQRLVVDGRQRLPLDQADKFQVYRTSKLSLSAGDVVRITQNGSTSDKKHTLNNGALYRVRGFNRSGDIVLQNGWTVSKDFGHLAHGYVVTSHASQGKTVDRVFVGQSSDSFPASSREQFYVSASRARESVTVYTDDKTALREAISHSDERLSAMDLFHSEHERQEWLVRQRHERDVVAEFSAVAARQSPEREEGLYDRR